MTSKEMVRSINTKLCGYNQQNGWPATAQPVKAAPDNWLYLNPDTFAAEFWLFELLKRLGRDSFLPIGFRPCHGCYRLLQNTTEAWGTDAFSRAEAMLEARLAKNYPGSWVGPRNNSILRSSMLHGLVHNSSAQKLCIEHIEGNSAHAVCPSCCLRSMAERDAFETSTEVVHERSFSKIGPWCRRERIVELGVILSLEVRRPVSAIHVNVMSFEKIRRCLREVVLSINMVYHRFQIGTVDTDNQSHYHHRFSSQTFRTRHVPRNRRIHFTCCH